MIYDGFIFFNELDLLEIRLHELEKVVDRFVIVEATKTFTNKPKPLYYLDNKERFLEFSDKIIHVVVDEFPEYTNAWDYEKHQRNAIARGLKNCHPKDTVIISDVDEFPSKDAIAKYKDTEEPVILIQKFFYYYLNCLCCHRFGIRRRRWLGSCILPFSKLSSADEIRANGRSKAMYKKIKNGGWHFSYLGGTEMIRHKIQSFSHQEYNDEKYTNTEKLEEVIKNGRDLFGRNNTFRTLEIDATFPEYIHNNQEKLRHLIAPDTNCSKGNVLTRVYRFLSNMLPTESRRPPMR